ncbi:MAG: SDR family NAD(P)-dependent oxidoreductase [Capnocytophaga felis]|nr:SDR family NAD(P)-dependent oxidoreductase [Capnocytophaga felis]
MSMLQNKNAIITGGSDSIGLGIAEAFAQNGANLILIGRSTDKLDKAKLQLAKYPVVIHLISADLDDTNQITWISEEITKYFSKVDILVNNAGIGKFVPFIQTEEQLLDLHLNLNVKTLTC